MRGGTRYSLPTHGSSSRLSSLVEETNKGKKKGKKESRNLYDISTSCVLLSDEDAVRSPTDEFSLGLEMSFTGSLEELDGAAASNKRLQNCTPRLADKNRGVKSASILQQNARLSQDLAAVQGETDDNLDGSPKIESFTMPFLFSPSIDYDKQNDEQSLTNECVGCPCLNGLADSLLIGGEMVAMAQARQSPIMLLSTSTNLVYTPQYTALHTSLLVVVYICTMCGLHVPYYLEQTHMRLLTLYRENVHTYTHQI